MITIAIVSHVCTQLLIPPITAKTTHRCFVDRE
jgi:hypothetical protein